MSEIKCGTCRLFERSSSTCRWEPDKYHWVPYWVKEQTDARIVEGDDGEDCETWDEQPLKVSP